MTINVDSDIFFLAISVYTLSWRYDGPDMIFHDRKICRQIIVSRSTWEYMDKVSLRNIDIERRLKILDHFFIEYFFMKTSSNGLLKLTYAAYYRQLSFIVIMKIIG